MVRLIWLIVDLKWVMFWWVWSVLIIVGRIILLCLFSVWICMVWLVVFRIRGGLISVMF